MLFHNISFIGTTVANFKNNFKKHDLILRKLFMKNSCKIGDKAELTKRITEEDIYLFAGITGDKNPVHISSDYAAKTIFKEKIAHGILTAGLISAVIGMKLPGNGTIYISQTLHFKAPVKINDLITATVEVKEIISYKKLVLSTYCTNQHGAVVLDGEAVVSPPRG